MLVAQKLIKENDKKGTVRLINQYDLSAAMDLAKELNGDGGSRSETGDMALMGYVPRELFGVDPWLIQARKAQIAGDMGEYTKMMKKFFQVHPEFAVLFKKKYF